MTNERRKMLLNRVSVQKSYSDSLRSKNQDGTQREMETTITTTSSIPSAVHHTLAPENNILDIDAHYEGMGIVSKQQQQQQQQQQPQPQKQKQQQQQQQEERLTLILEEIVCAENDQLHGEVDELFGNLSQATPGIDGLAKEGEADQVYYYDSDDEIANCLIACLRSSQPQRTPRNRSTRTSPRIGGMGTHQQ